MFAPFRVATKKLTRAAGIAIFLLFFNIFVDQKINKKEGVSKVVPEEVESVPEVVESAPEVVESVLEVVESICD